MSLPKFTLGIHKMQSAEAGRAAGHNCRLHKTASQLPKEAWFTPEGRHEIMPWNHAALKRARKLSGRKDAVVAISFSFQVGEQGYWRHPPIEKGGKVVKEGLPKLTGKAFLDEANKVAEGARAWALKEFGADNILGIDLHTDESSPHVHVVVTPVNDGALQAKHWLDGRARCAQLRRRAWIPVNDRIPCTYTAGAAGGAPHDERLAAGKALQLAKRDRRMRDFQDNLDQRGVDLYAAEKALERDRLALDEKAARLEEHIGKFNEAVLAMQGREADLYEREKALKDDLAALEASTPEGIKAARDEARKHNVLLQDTLRNVIKAMSSAEVALFAKSLRSPEQQQLVRAIMIGQGRDHGYGHGG